MSEALRNLSLDHANSGPFQKHYLGRNVCANTWGILRGQKPQQALLKQACSIGHSISKRRPIDLTSEQAASVTTDPRIMRLTSQLRSLRRGSKEHKETHRELRNLKQRLKKKLKQRIRDDWTDEQAVDDIERQLQGVGFAEPILDDAINHPQRPAQSFLIEALTVAVDDTLEGQYRRRDNAIDAIVAYCGVEEGRTLRRTNMPSTKKALASSACGPSGPSEGSRLFLATMSIFVNDPKERPRRCFLCIGAALSLAPDDSCAEDLNHEFYTSGDLTKHFRRRHLSYLEDNVKPECQVCDMTLSNKMHLQNHAMLVHGTIS